MRLFYMAFQLVRISERLLAELARKVIDVRVTSDMLHERHLSGEALAAERAVVRVDALVRLDVAPEARDRAVGLVAGGAHQRHRLARGSEHLREKRGPSVDVSQGLQWAES